MIWEPYYDDKSMRESDPPSTYDWTMRSTYRACPRKFYWFMRGVDYVAIPYYFTFGRAWQITLDSWYTDQLTHDASPRDKIEKATVALAEGRKAWEEDGTEGEGINSLQNMEALFWLYVNNFPVEPFKVIGAERGWTWPLAGTPYLLGGSLDDYIEWPPYGVLLMETKTSGVYLSDSFVRGWSFSGQVTQYIWALSKLHGKEIFGCLMNLACKRVPKKKAAEGLFVRNLEKRSPAQLDRFEEEVLLDIKDIEREWDRWIWPRTTDQIQCVGGIGKSPCLFQNICLQDVDPWDIDPIAYQGIKWREEKWEPWKRG